MAQSAYIYLVEESTVPAMTLDDVKAQLQHYQEQTSKTGEQLDWAYTAAAFPYSIESKPGEEDRYFYLKGTNPKYHYLLFGVGKETVPPIDDEEEAKERHYIQVVLPDDATFGDKSKGNEYCKFIAKRLQAELHLFNGRVMYFYPRK